MKLNGGAALVVPEGGGPAGVVDGFPNAKAPLVLVAAGVVLPAWLYDVGLDAVLPNGLVPPALRALPKRLVFGVWPELEESDDLLGVARLENSAVLFDASEPGGFPKSKPEL